MKRIATIFATLCLLANFAGFALAAKPGTPEYQKLKEYKKTEREKKNTPSTLKEKGFWQKEAERSGFAGTAAMFTNAVSNAIPLDKPNSRK
ncbi:MAG: hypothetical protein AUJ72_04145 [Candidatus Omnitrophica bacterium CG1_02_46_14]|nr:MAG: hypothetical protein AUJ72_04145 [Candidatus Omnitrophica bacterium CG1_02_46_14]